MCHSGQSEASLWGPFSLAAMAVPGTELTHEQSRPVPLPDTPSHQLQLCDVLVNFHYTKYSCMKIHTTLLKACVQSVLSGGLNKSGKGLHSQDRDGSQKPRWLRE